MNTPESDEAKARLKSKQQQSGHGQHQATGASPVPSHTTRATSDSESLPGQHHRRWTYEGKAHGDGHGRHHQRLACSAHGGASSSIGESRVHGERRRRTKHRSSAAKSEPGTLRANEHAPCGQAKPGHSPTGHAPSGHAPSRVSAPPLTGPPSSAREFYLRQSSHHQDHRHHHQRAHSHHGAGTTPEGGSCGHLCSKKHTSASEPGVSSHYPQPCMCMCWSRPWVKRKQLVLAHTPTHPHGSHK